MEPLQPSLAPDPLPKANELPPPLPPPRLPDNAFPLSQTLPSPTKAIPVVAVESQQKSFRDTLLDGNASSSPPLVTLEELIKAEEKMEAVTFMVEDMDSTGVAKIPKVKIPKEIWQRLCVPFNNAIIVKLLGKSVHFHVLQARLSKEWRTEYEYDFIDIGLGYYIVKFASPADRMAVLMGGPYKIFDHYLIVQPWEPSFQPARAKAPKTAVWIKLHGVPAMCYHESVVLYLARKLGNPIKVDRVTLLATRGKFARVCVEVDLSQRLPSTVDLDLEDLPQSLILVECEGLHKICFHCGEYGHREEACRRKNPTSMKEDGGSASKFTSVNGDCARAIVALSQSLKPEIAENDMIYGQWMIAKRKPRRAMQSRSIMGNSNFESDNNMESQGITVPKGRVNMKKKGKEVREQNLGSKGPNSNRVAIMSKVMEEQSELLGQEIHTAIVQFVAPKEPAKQQAQHNSTHMTPAPTTVAQDSQIQQSTLDQKVVTHTKPNHLSKDPPNKNRPKTLKLVSKISKPSLSKPVDPHPITQKHSSIILENQQLSQALQMPLQPVVTQITQAPIGARNHNALVSQQQSSNHPPNPTTNNIIVVENITPPALNVAATLSLTSSQ